MKVNIYKQSHASYVWVQQLKEDGSLHNLTEGHWTRPYLSWLEVFQAFREAPELVNL